MGSMKKLTPISLFLLAVISASSFLHGEEVILDSQRDAVKALKEEIYSINLVNLLDLSSSQVDVILTQSRMARPFYEARKEMLREIYPLQVRVFREFKAADEENRGLPDPLMKKTGKAERLEKEVNDKLIARVNTLSEDVYEILSPGQLRIINYYKPFLFPREYRDREMKKKSDKRWGAAREALFEARSFSERKYKLKKEKVVTTIFNLLPGPRQPAGKGARGAAKKKKARAAAPPAGGRYPSAEGRYLSAEDEKTVREKIGKVLDEVRKLSKDELEERADFIIEHRLLTTEKDQLLKEMREIGRSKHEQLNNVSRYVLNPDIIDYLEDLKKKCRKDVMVGVR